MIKKLLTFCLFVSSTSWKFQLADIDAAGNFCLPVKFFLHSVFHALHCVSCRRGLDAPGGSVTIVEFKLWQHGAVCVRMTPPATATGSTSTGLAGEGEVIITVRLRHSQVRVLGVVGRHEVRLAERFACPTWQLAKRRLAEEC